MLEAKEALDKLLAGNERFKQGKSIHPNNDIERRESLIEGQKPYAAILSCSDSRVPVEIIFDAGLGDIFAIRSAGHVLSKNVIGSLEYALMNLGVKLIVILGHTECGALTTAVKTYQNDSFNELTDSLQSVVGHIHPAFNGAPCDCCDVKNVNEIAHLHVQYQLDDLLVKNKYIAKRVKNKEILLVGAVYNISTGKVEMI